LGLFFTTSPAKKLDTMPCDQLHHHLQTTTIGLLRVPTNQAIPFRMFGNMQKYYHSSKNCNGGGDHDGDDGDDDDDDDDDADDDGVGGEEE
jgi:hypothetical protein